MFTGLIKDIGTVKKITTNASGKELVIESKNLINEIAIDDSIATNGVCLTATKIEGQSFHVQAVYTTLEKTTIGKLASGSRVNLELALRASDRLGGHFVQGHVNGLGVIKSILKQGNNYEIEVKVPDELRKYFIAEGSIALDGISLTIARLSDSSITVSIIPHTFENTNLFTKRIGDNLNIEVDMMAKYLENFLRFQDKDERLRKLLDA